MLPARHLARPDVGRRVAGPGEPRGVGVVAERGRLAGVGGRSAGMIRMIEGSGAPGTWNTQARPSGLWRMPAGHRPTRDEAPERLANRKSAGESDHAFGWSYLKAARLRQQGRCGAIAAE